MANVLNGTEASFWAESLQHVTGAEIQALIGPCRA